MNQVHIVRFTGSDDCHAEPAFLVAVPKGKRVLSYVKKELGMCWKNDFGPWGPGLPKSYEKLPGVTATKPGRIKFIGYNLK